MLISAPDLASHLRDPGWIIVDCRFNLMKPDAGRQSYLESHIPGAYYAHLDHDLAAPRRPGTGRHPLPDPAALRALFSSWGVEPATRVIAYDDSSGALAARLWWLLRWMGHRHTGLLDGGFNAWKAAGLPLDSGVPASVSGNFRGEPGHVPTVDVAEIEQDLDRGHLLVLDARTLARFQGREEPIDPVAGHIPGAVNAPFSDNLNADGTFRRPDELRKRFLGLMAGRRPEQVACMCGSGVTACHNLFALDLAGFTGPRLYNGSWSEWVTDPNRPVSTVPPELPSGR